MRSILLVDDSFTYRQAMAKTIKMIGGYQMTEAQDGKEALERLSEGAFDIMLLDLRMPLYDGLYVLARYRDISPGTAVVVLTAHGTLEAAQMAIRQGAKDFLIKPATIETIRDALARAVEQDEYIEFGQGAFQINLRSGQVFNHGQEIVLPPIPAQVLVGIATRADGATYLELAKAIYNRDMSETDAYNKLRQHITILRSQLADYTDSSCILRRQGRFLLADREPVNR